MRGGRTNQLSRVNQLRHQVFPSVQALLGQILFDLIKAPLRIQLRHSLVERPPWYRSRPGQPPPCVRKVDVRLPGKRNSNSHGARPGNLIITMIKWVRTRRLSIKNSLSPPPVQGLHLRLIDSCITQLKAQGPSRTCNESNEEDVLWV